MQNTTRWPKPEGKRAPGIPGDSPLEWRRRRILIRSLCSFIAGRGRHRYQPSHNQITTICLIGPFLYFQFGAPLENVLRTLRFLACFWPKILADSFPTVTMFSVLPLVFSLPLTIPFLYSRGTGRMIPDEKSLKMIPSEFRYHFLDGKMILGKNNTLREKTLKKWYRQSSGTIFEQPRLEYSEISDVEKAYNFHFWHGFHCIFRCFSKKSPMASELTIIFVFSWYHWTSLLLWNSRLTCP